MQGWSVPQKSQRGETRYTAVVGALGAYPDINKFNDYQYYKFNLIIDHIVKKNKSLKLATMTYVFIDFNKIFIQVNKRAFNLCLLIKIIYSAQFISSKYNINFELYLSLQYIFKQTRISAMFTKKKDNSKTTNFLKGITKETRQIIQEYLKKHWPKYQPKQGKTVFYDQIMILFIYLRQYQRHGSLSAEIKDKIFAQAEKVTLKSQLTVKDIMNKTLSFSNNEQIIENIKKNPNKFQCQSAERHKKDMQSKQKNPNESSNLRINPFKSNQEPQDKFAENERLFFSFEKSQELVNENRIAQKKGQVKEQNNELLQKKTVNVGIKEQDQPLDGNSEQQQQQLSKYQWLQALTLSDNLIDEVNIFMDPRKDNEILIMLGL